MTATTELLVSDFRPLAAVQLPHRGRQRYMHTFDLADPQMPEGYEDYLAPVLALTRAAGATKGIAHMTVDEKVVKAGMSQRRPGPHVDGCFVPKAAGWEHRPRPTGWLHGCNNISAEPVPARMPVIVASSVAGCRAWRGEFHGTPKSDGDCSHIPLNDEPVVLPANVGFLLSADCVHESMRFTEDTQRTFLRIALPNDFPFEREAVAV